MAQLDQEFDSEQHEGMKDFSPIPPGVYRAYIAESDVKQTKAGDGKYAKFQWRIIDGEYENRVIFDTVTLENPNQQAVDIGQRQLKSICDAVGKRRIRDTSELHDIPCIITVKIKPARDQYEASNAISKYERADGTEVQQAAAPASTTAKAAPTPTPTAPSRAATPPWKKK